MYWKTPQAPEGKIQTQFGTEPGYSDYDPKQFSRARIVYGSCDMNVLLGMEDMPVPDKIPASPIIKNGVTYHLHRGEALRDLISFVFLRDEGDAPPPSVQATIDAAKAGE